MEQVVVVTDWEGNVYGIIPVDSISDSELQSLEDQAEYYNQRVTVKPVLDGYDDPMTALMDINGEFDEEDDEDDEEEDDEEAE